MFGKTAPQEPLSLESKIESILYYKAQDVSIKDLGSILDVPPKDIKASIKTLSESLKERGLSLVSQGNKVALVTDTRAADIIASFQKQEEEKPLSKSALETLSIVAYKGPVGRAELDYIRGVNSTYALRNLILRGLVQKTKDGHATLYSPTLEALRFIGVESQSDLPYFESLNEKAKAVITEEAKAEEEREATVFDAEDKEEE